MSHFGRRLSLRARLCLIAVGLVAVGLTAAGLATRLALQSFLLDRVDQQFVPAVRPVAQFFVRGDTDPGARQQVYGVLPPNSYAAVLSANGTVLARQPFGSVSEDSAEQIVSAGATAPAGISTVGGYRVAIIPAAQTTDGSPGPVLNPTARLVLAIPLTDFNSTLNRLTLLELLVGLIVVGCVATLAYILVRREFRPLERMETTAAAIAAGDLSRRVEDDDPATEVGRLGAALNAMLVQIELAFDERRQSENRLRRFVADASHELKTPLTSVRGFAELFRRGAAGRPEDLALAMRRIESEAERMGILVDDLLVLAKLDQGRPVGSDPVDLRSVVTELVSDHRILHPEWPIEFHVEGDGTVIGDELRLRQAITNLLSNARTHTPPGTPITVRLSTAGDSRMIEVADEGPGIAPELLPRVFERFVRADPSRTRASGGSGLGLSIVAAIVEAHGGRVEALGGPGAGATFRLWLPAAHGSQSTHRPLGEASQATHPS
jgi:two-component system OmpR family sensor kinase